MRRVRMNSRVFLAVGLFEACALFVEPQPTPQPTPPPPFTSNEVARTIPQ
jgi:hypothetical protein